MNDYKFRLDKMERSIRIIQEVLDYTLEGSVAQQNRHIWVCNALTDILNGVEVTRPKRQ